MKRTSLTSSIDNRRAQWLKGVLDLFVLARLRDGEAYGYELARSLEDAGFGEIKGGTLYPLLNRLERDGMVNTAWRASEQGPDRKYYRIAGVGEHTLAEASEAWIEFAGAALEMLSITTKEPS